ncbi:recombinase family protein [Selenomonas montiformis]|uniref:recombinase family protein n=1 Tax=Selenomonas montiformis TaxID=2652285 RepID=UPI003F8CCA37
MDMEHLFKMEIEQLTAGDTLMAAKLDRIARTAAEGASVIRSLQERGVAVHILNIGILDTSTTGRLMMNVLLAFTEFERDMIVERTQAGREIARTHAGYRKGRRPLPKARKDAAVAMVRNGRIYQEACEATGLSRSTVLRAVQAFRAQ